MSTLLVQLLAVIRKEIQQIAADPRLIRMLIMAPVVQLLVFGAAVDFMQGVIPTAENIVVEFWKVLEPAVAPAKLKRLLLRETENNYVEYTGN